MVIDTCKEKQSSFDPDNRMPLLLEVFASQDSLRQRRGRAGRVRPGVCYKLISKEHHSNLPAHGTPEIKRSAIEQTLLSLLFLGLENGSGDFLRSMIDPPSKQSIESALKCLEQLGAIERKGVHATLCPLGRHLSGIPAPPTVAKLLVMGSLLGCRSISLAIAAGLSVGRSPFIRLSSSQFQRRDTNNPEQEEQAANDQILEARRALFKSVGNSEHCMLGRAYLLWDEAKGAERRKFCGKIA
jgi:ATP-dependent RNA helicase DHX57